MLKSLENSSYISGQLGFSFDIVVVLIDLGNTNVEEKSKLAVDAIFNNNNIKITSSRINVNEFKPERSFEFKERPSVLKEKLFKHPLECQVYYNNGHIGTSTFLWPESFISCIAEGCGRELMRCDEADIKKDKQKVGRMEIIIRLQIKCQEYEEKEPLKRKLNFCNADDNELNPNDVMFVVGQTNASFSCSDVGIIPGSSATGSSAHAACLDLSDFRHVHGKTLSNTNILESIKAKCCKKKESAHQYKDMIKDLLDKANDIPQSSQSSCNPQIKSMQGLSEKSLDSCSSSDSWEPAYCISDESASEGGKSMSSIREKPTKRYCSLCHDDISWLPKFTACPKCGFKPISYHVEEKPYDHTLTANKILQEYVNYAPPNEQSNIICQKKCRCTCRGDKICAHCRIKKLCKDIFPSPHSGNADCGTCETKSSDLYNICKTNSRECRPYLAKVFQDLKELFEINEAKKIGKISKNLKNVNSNPLQAAQLTGTGNKHNQRSPCEEKPIDEHCKQESCKNKISNCNKQSKCTAVGHKTCLMGHTIVPRKMGWLWNAEANRSRSGWMPGAIRKPIKVLMQHFLNKKKFHGSVDCHRQQKEENCCSKEPTLHINKKNGAYYVTLRPLKALGALQDCSKTHLNMQPIQFKISKNPIIYEMRKLKTDLKNQGFSKCTCHQPISKCCCRNFLERKRLEYQCCKECYKRDLPNCTDNLILSDTTDSEAEFDFCVTPPAGTVQHNSCLKKIKTVSSGTQYEEDDWKFKPEYPKPLKKYFKLHNCAIGNRFQISENVSNKRPKHVKFNGMTGPEAFRGPDGKFSMAQYVKYKESIKPTPEEMIEIRKRKMKLLAGANPPLLCKVDRRGKPINVCHPCCSCFSDNRIC